MMKRTAYGLAISALVTGALAMSAPLAQADDVNAGYLCDEPGAEADAIVTVNDGGQVKDKKARLVCDPLNDHEYVWKILRFYE
ncbi:hypothetical protein ACQP0C_36805 [Nocardia sp. CA-129566]|uniref:hypothetical protein n=1 Tax=Nocardia sp. CA-129566 TaxID=3239976 RepID=UPI003D9997D1